MKKSSPIILCLLSLVGILFHSLTPTTSAAPLELAKLMLGLISLILVPGIFITNLLNKEPLRYLAFAFVFGFLLQLLNVYVIWWLYTIFGTINFVDLLYLLTAFFTLILMFYSLKLNRDVKYGIFLKKDPFIIVPVAICIAVTLFYPGFSANFHSDGAVYLDLARRVVSNNVFSSNVIQTPLSWAAAQFSTGMLDHFFGYSAIAVFFALGSISLQMAEFALLFGILLALFPLYAMSEKLFNRQVARITCLLVSISPIILNHIRLVGGPEITSLLFTVMTVYLFLIIIEEEFSRPRLCLVAGITLFVAWFAWLLNGYLFIFCLPFLFLLYGSKFHHRSWRFGFLALTLLVSCFFLDLLLVGQITLRYIAFPLPLTFTFASLIIFKWNKRFNLPNFYIIFLATSLCLIFFASYLPRVVSYPFIQFDTSHYSTAQTQVTANAAQTLDTLKQAFDLNGVVRRGNQYFFGTFSYSWSGLLNSVGILTVFLSVASLARLNKMRETLLVFSFPVLHMLIWILISPSNYVLQPRYLLSATLFYFILSASTIEFIISAVSSQRLNKISNAIFKRASPSSTVFVKICAGILLLSMVVALSQPIYANLSENVNYWNYESKLNWNDAIAWIKTNTTSNDVIASVYGDCFSWLTNRKTVFLYNDLDPNANMSMLTDLIKELEVNYLVVDIAFGWQFDKLKGLYESPTPFLGSTIVFVNQNPAGNNVIIYNVTNIAYGTLLRFEFEPNWGELGNWQPLVFYSNGSISTSQGAVRFDLKVAETPWPSIASTYTFPSPENLSQYSSMDFWMLAPESSKIVLEVNSGSLLGQSYFSYLCGNVEYNKWFEVNFDLKNYTNLVGEPNLNSVTFVNFIVGGLSVGESETLFIKNVTFYADVYR